MVTTYGFGRNNYDYNNLSPQAASDIDIEIDEIVTKCYRDTVKILRDNMYQLERLKEKLIEEEIVDGKWVYELFGRVSFD
jgi:cell division protease FtsH